MSCDRAPSFLGAYVLGALAAEERRDAERHLADCPACAAELAEFEDLTALLDRVPADDVTAEPVRPSPELFGRVAAEVRRPARRRLLVAAGVAAALAMGAGTWIAIGDDAQVRTATSGSVRVTVTAKEGKVGTALKVTVAGLERGQRCSVVAVDDEGDWSSAGDWTVPGGTVSYDTWTEVPPDDLASVVLLGDNGHQMIEVPF